MTPTRRTANRHHEQAAQVRAAISPYAVLNLTGRIVLCTPRDIELCFYPLAGNPQWTGNNGKVCYPDEAAADRAALAIALIDGADEVVSYPCPRGDHHHHVRATRRAREHALIVEQVAAATRQHR